MKCIGAEWLVKLYEHLENNPHIIVNGFRHASIFRALNILTDIGDTNLVDYSDSSSEDTMSDAEENEIIVPDNVGYQMYTPTVMYIHRACQKLLYWTLSNQPQATIKLVYNYTYVFNMPTGTTSIWIIKYYYYFIYYVRMYSYHVSIR